MTRLRLIAVAAFVTAAAAAPPPAPPSILYGPLFEAVQRARVFPDSKTFADAAPKRDPAAIMTDYRRLKPADLKAFVEANFTLPSTPPPPPPAARTPLAQHIRALWPILTRKPETPPAGSSALSLPAPYVVPGGRFREIYYWDSYFTMLGLIADGRRDLIESMLDDFVHLIERHGRVPNGTRSYYLSRSQPPVFALMTTLSDSRDPKVRARRLAAMRTEHGFWMHGVRCLGRLGACARVIRMPDGALLNRYYDDLAEPRDESYAEDVATAAAAAPREAAETYRDLRAAAESGWDFSSRWLNDPQRLQTIRTTAIVPVDLNSLLYSLERRIAGECGAAGDAPCTREFAERSARRAAAVQRYLWLAAEGRYADWDRERSEPTPVLSAATLYPLWAGIASPAQAQAVAWTVRAKLLAPGGLRTTLSVTGEQWDRPNGWAPLQWIAFEGLERNGEAALARTIACRFLATVQRTYGETGKLLEKYDLEERRPGGGGEYPTQDGFGWTNGVTQALLARHACAEADVTPGRVAGGG